MHIPKNFITGRPILEKANLHIIDSPIRTAALKTMKKFLGIKGGMERVVEYLQVDGTYLYWLSSIISAQIGVNFGNKPYTLACTHKYQPLVTSMTVMSAAKGYTFNRSIVISHYSREDNSTIALAIGNKNKDALIVTPYIGEGSWNKADYTILLQELEKLNVPIAGIITVIAENRDFLHAISLKHNIPVLGVIHKDEHRDILYANI